MREIRCHASRGGEEPANSWAGTGTETPLGAFFSLRAMVEGPIDDRTGYLCDIKAIDRVLRAQALPIFLSGNGRLSGELAEIAAGLGRAFHAAASPMSVPVRLQSLELRLSPFTRLTVHREDPRMVLLTQSYEFAAAHRLSCMGLSDDENLRLFGKCSNPHGHGHNYIVEVTIGGPIDAARGQILDLPRLDRIVRQNVIDRFDHKNLNVECPEFAELNPTVENIARVIWRQLRDTVPPARLNAVRVWETGKTYAECTGDE